MSFVVPTFVSAGMTKLDASFVWKEDLAHIGKLEGFADPMKVEAEG